MTTPCALCEFDPAEWNDQDTARTLGRADYLLAHAVAGLPASLQRAVDELPAWASPGLPARPAMAVGGSAAVGATDRDAVHRLLHHVVAVAELRAAAGDLPPSQYGAVVQVNASGGGVPKRSVTENVVGRGGLVGDRQRSRVHHGRPWQALCLWSAEVIAALAAEGHPVTAGAAGENLTIGGVDWASLRSGLVLEVGEVRCRLSVPAEPCSNINGCFAGTSSRRIDHDRHPGWSRWYATVLGGGVIRQGDVVVVAPR